MNSFSLNNAFLTLFFYFIYLTIPSSIVGQEPIPFTKHYKVNNLLVGNKAGFEMPVYFGSIFTTDNDYEGTEAKSPLYFGVSPKFTLKNAWGRGIAFGVGLDYSTGGYFRANLLLDLDFLFAYDIDINENGRPFKPSMFTKFEFSKLLAKVNGDFINEYYLSFNVFKLQIGKIAGEFGISIDVLRDKYTPFFADKGTYYKLSYFIF